MTYAALIARKLSAIPATGLINVENIELPHGLFDHQDVLTRWALRRGRAAIFADTGLGKTRMQLAWASVVHAQTGLDVLILAPLAVAAQTVKEGAEIGVQVTHCRELSDVQTGINITNYDRLHKFDCARFGAVVLDESSIIKHHDAKTLGILLSAFKHCAFKLCATATPAPNDWTELGTHAEFLGVCSRVEMLSEYFLHDGGDTQKWRLKGHAREVFWRWVATWGALLTKPSDLGYDDSRYALPPLTVVQHVSKADQSQAAEMGLLFAMEASTLSERRAARRASLASRVAACAELVNADNEPWIVWCDLNDEGEALKAAIPGSVEIRGSDTVDDKEQRLRDFADGKIRVLISKPKICGWGLNWQHCARIAFVGVTDSFEAYYQAVRRCWRFGQLREVLAHIFTSELEGAVVANLKRKETAAIEMAASLSSETNEVVRESVTGITRSTNVYDPRKVASNPSWLNSEDSQ